MKNEAETISIIRGTINGKAKYCRIPIRSMSDEELAHFLEMEAGRFVSFYPTPAKTWLDWLRLDAKESIRLKDLFPSMT